jgi:hypothetical protein
MGKICDMCCVILFFKLTVDYLLTKFSARVITMFYKKHGSPSLRLGGARGNNFWPYEKGLRSMELEMYMQM